MNFKPYYPQDKKPKKKKLSKVEKLIASGYRKTSNAYRHITRIDRPDWEQALADSHLRGMKWVKGLGDGAEDHYRRCYSDDTITVDIETFKQIPPSNWAVTGYCKKIL